MARNIINKNDSAISRLAIRDIRIYESIFLHGKEKSFNIF